MATNWFPHESSAGMDQHILMLRGEWGSTGYGLFWLALEAMYETSDGMLDAAALPALTIRMAESRDTVVRFFDYCIGIGLFIKKDGKIYSERLLEEKRRMLAKSEAQRTRAENRWSKEKNNKSNAVAVPDDCRGNAPTVHTVHTVPTESGAAVAAAHGGEVSSEAEGPTPAKDAAKFFAEPDVRSAAADHLAASGYPRDVVEKEIQKFWLYWTEPTPNGKRQRWQTQKTFEVKRRLLTWLSRAGERGQSYSATRTVLSAD